MSPSAEEREGVLRFQAEHREETLPEAWSQSLGPLLAWRGVLRTVGWVGQDPARYGGYGYGNLSLRLPGEEGFLITGSQTSGARRVELSDFVRVHAWSLENNSVASCGETLPSSESLSHAALYAVSPEIQAVLHVHAPELFAWARAAGGSGPPATAPQVEAGTPEMGREIARVWQAEPPEGLGASRQGVIVMGGHPDGLLAFGDSVGAAGRSLVRMAVAAARQSLSSSEAAAAADSSGAADRS